MRYVRWPSRRGSWHVWARHIGTAYTVTRCGRRMAYEDDTRESLPLNERTCERCAVLALHDEQPDVENDTVPG